MGAQTYIQTLSCRCHPMDTPQLGLEKKRQHQLRKNRIELKSPPSSAPPSHPPEMTVDTIALPQHNRKSVGQCWLKELHSPAPAANLRASVSTHSRSLRNARAGIWRWGLLCWLLPFGLTVENPQVENHCI